MTERVERAVSATRIAISIGALAALLPLWVASCGDARMEGDLIDNPVDADLDVPSEALDVPSLRDGRSIDASDEAIGDLVVTENPSNVLAFYAEYETLEAVITDVELDCGPSFRPQLTGDVPRRQHRVLLLGLWEGARCELRVWSVAGGDAVYRAAPIEVGALPDTLPELTTAVLDAARMRPGWTLFNLSNQFDGALPQIVVVDEQGRYRWYHQRSTTWAGADIDTYPLGDRGVLIGGNVGTPRPAIVSWGGEVLWQGSFDMHHEIQPVGDEDHLLYLALTRCDDGNVSDLLVERDIAADDEVVWSWRLCDHYTPDPPFEDWSHTNTVAPYPDGRHWLLSLRNQNSLLKLDRVTGDILWGLGFNGRPEDGFRGDFEMEVADRFYNQHAPQVLDNGNVVLFDNGMRGVREYSRAIEIAIDEERRSAEVVWEYRHDPDLFAATWSEADRLDNGNTLIAFGVRSRVELAHLVEATADAETVWDVVLPARWSLYRAERIAPLTGQVLDAR